MAKLDFDMFEKVIIQQCLKTNSSYLPIVIDHLTPDIFHNDDIKDIVKIITDFYRERDTVPSLTEIAVRLNTNDLKESFRNVVADIKKLDSKYNEDELVQNTEYFVKQRKFSSLMEKAIDERTKSKEYDLDDIHAESEKIHSISLFDNLGLDFIHESDRVKKFLTEKNVILSTGYAGLDEAFGGGLQAEGKAFYDIGGETNVGKSIFLANIAVNVIMQNKNVVIISPEMSEMRYAKRIAGIITGIAIKSLPEQLDEYDKRIEQLKKRIAARLIIKEVPTKGVSVKNIHGYLLKLKRQLGFVPDLICIDGHTLLKASNPNAKKHEEIQNIVQECRALSYAFPAPILSVAQLNRSSHNTDNPSLDKIAGSWDSVQDMDGHVNIWQTDVDRESGIIHYGGKKSRDGSKGHSGYLHIDYDTLRLVDENDRMKDMCEDMMKDLPHAPPTNAEMLDLEQLLA